MRGAEPAAGMGSTPLNQELKIRCYPRSSVGRAGNWVHRLTQLNRSGRSTVLLPPGGLAAEDPHREGPL